MPCIKGARGRKNEAGEKCKILKVKSSKFVHFPAVGPRARPRATGSLPLSVVPVPGRKKRGEEEGAKRKEEKEQEQ